jgi:hypothetical protein
MRDSPWSIVFQVVIMVPSAAGFIIVLSRLIPIIMRSGRKPKLSHVVLSLEALAFSIRIIFAVDVMGIRALQGPFFTYFISTTSGAVALVADLLVLFYWNRALDVYGVRKDLEKRQRYVYIIIALIFVAEIISATLRGLAIAGYVNVVTQVLYGLVSIGIIVYISYTAHNLYKYFKDSEMTKKQEKARGKLIKMTRILIAVAVLIFIFAIFSVIYFLAIFKRAYTEIVWWVIMNSIVSAIGICETFLFRVPSGKGVRSSREPPTKTPRTATRTSESLSNKKSSTSSNPEDSNLITTGRSLDTNRTSLPPDTTTTDRETEVSFTSTSVSSKSVRIESKDADSNDVQTARAQESESSVTVTQRTDSTPRVPAVPLEGHSSSGSLSD